MLEGKVQTCAEFNRSWVVQWRGRTCWKVLESAILLLLLLQLLLLLFLLHPPILPQTLVHPLEGHRPTAGIFPTGHPTKASGHRPALGSTGHSASILPSQIPWLPHLSWGQWAGLVALAPAPWNEGTALGALDPGSQLKLLCSQTPAKSFSI